MQSAVQFCCLPLRHQRQRNAVEAAVILGEELVGAVEECRWVRAEAFAEWPVAR